jgi:peptidoglycan/LPS O-acetylase OafA/YrhL
MNTRMNYYKQIDGLRAVAVIAVIAHHWVSKSYIHAHIIHWGAYGVDLFFVISGFLITGILIHEKKNDRTLLANIKTFYIRRSLRIFPIYYLYVFLLFCFNWPELKTSAISLTTYVFNLDMYFNGWSAIPYIQHLWSLSVEEQFYLLWPLLLLSSTTKKAYGYIILLLIVSFIISTSFFLFSPFKEIKLFTPFSFISLCLGSILAFMKEEKIKIPYQTPAIILILAIFICFKSDLLPHFSGKNIIGYIIPFPSCIFCLLVWKASEGYTGIGRILLENSILIFIGKISYGLYLYHLIIPYIFFENTSVLFISWNLGILFSIAVFSYYAIEKPLNTLKDKFPYDK